MIDSSNAGSELTRGRLLARNTLWNLAAQILPVVVGIATVPFIVNGLGVTRFGLLSLGWIIIGYFGLFDFGMGRALTKLVADRLGANDTCSIPALAWTSLLLILALGLLGGVVVAASAPWLIYKTLRVPEALQSEALRSFFLMSIAIPFITLTSGLRGILEALQRFRVLTLIRIPMGILSVAGPLLVLPFSSRLVPVIAVLVLGRVLGCVAHLVICLRALPALRRNVGFNRSLALPVFKFGGWMTVSNIVSPIMVYMDRFLIGALLSMSAVAYYTVPLDFVIRLTFIPSALVGVLFPAFAITLMNDRGRARLLLRRGLKYTLFVIFPLVCVIIALAPDLLRVWLGASFAENSSGVLRWLAVGTLLNCLSYLPFTLIQSAGRPDITAKLHLVELPIYLLMLVPLVKIRGVEGAAIAWTGRVALDGVLLSFYGYRLLPQGLSFLMRAVGTLATLILGLYLTTLPGTLTARATILGLSLLGFVFASWAWALDSGERVFLFRTRREA